MADAKHTLAWAAGFFEGEGWINIQRKEIKGRVRHVLNSGITNTEIILLERFRIMFGGRVRPRPGTAISRKPLWEWRAEGLTAEKPRSSPPVRGAYCRDDQFSPPDL